MENDFCTVEAVTRMPLDTSGRDFDRLVDRMPANLGELHDKAEAIVGTVLRNSDIPPYYGKALMRILFDLRKLSEQ